MNDIVGISAWILFIVVLISLVSGFVFFILGFTRIKKTWLRRSKDLQGVDYSPFKKAEPWFFDQHPQDLWIESKDHLKLHAYYLPAQRNPKYRVILHHGYTSQGRNMALFAKLYKDHFDCDILAIDMRAHGTSEGLFIGFGWPEKEDTRLWIEKLAELTGQRPPVILHGLSMGASTVLNLAGNDGPDDVKLIIADSGFSDLNRQFKRQLKMIFKLPAFPIIPIGSLWCRLVLGFSFKSGSPIQTAANIQVPTLIIHGLKDMFVPHPMSNELYERLTCPKALVHYPNASHALAYPLNPNDYENQVLTFIRKHLP